MIVPSGTSPNEPIGMLALRTRASRAEIWLSWQIGVQMTMYSNAPTFLPETRTFCVRPSPTSNIIRSTPGCSSKT